MDKEIFVEKYMFMNKRRLTTASLKKVEFKSFLFTKTNTLEKWVN